MMEYYVDDRVTCQNLAKQFCCGVEEICGENGRDAEHTFYIGECVRLPKWPSCRCGRFCRLSNEGSIMDIALKYDISPDALLMANPYLQNGKGTEEQIIIIPYETGRWSKTMECREYTVDAGEIVSDILRKFEMSIVMLAHLNPEKNILNIEAGDILNVPKWENERCGAGYYLVDEGEDLSILAEKFTISAVELLRSNPNLRPQEFCTGQRIKLPGNVT